MILLVRHGEATHHTQNLTGGWTDSFLTERGKKQMRTLAAAWRKIFRAKEPDKDIDKRSKKSKGFGRHYR
jgi:probable phosphoglycerate mutase